MTPDPARAGGRGPVGEDATGVQADSGDALVALHEVTLVRGGQPVIDRVTWRVRRGERWAVLGPNGSGKTSILQLASTYELPSRGTVDVLGRRVGRTDLRELRKRIGYASVPLERLLRPQVRAVDAVLTAKHAALLRWRQEYEPEDWERADTLLAGMGVAALRDRMVSTLSEGERRRVGLARALMGEPELLLLDEPTAGLDLAGREDLVARLSFPVGDGPGAVVLVTHHVEEIPAGATHLALLRGGQLLATGPVGEVLTSEALSACFGLPLRLERLDGRWFAWGASRRPV